MLSIQLALEGSYIPALYGTSYQRIVVAGADGKIKYKGNSNAGTSIEINNIKDVLTAELEGLSPTSIINPNNPNILPEILKSYPNLARNEFNIEFKSNQNYGIYQSILDITGKEIIKTFVKDDNSITVDVSELKPGTYFYRLASTENEMNYPNQFRQLVVVQ